ncbi:MAG: TlpA family protein disulfide reductase [Deltaproteobacteria bacterium]|nr:TlpA family protein disulfide reductase [Deltaproteobacteria bacterium]
MSTAPSLSRSARVALAVAGAALLAAVLGWKAWDNVTGDDRRAEERFGISTSGAPAPPFSQPLADGGNLSLADLRGQVVFVNFWATWCPPCRDEMPSMLQLGRELELQYPGRFRMVAVSVDEGWDVVKGYFGGRVPAGLAVTLDVEQEATKAYYCAARGKCPDGFKFPETYIVDKAGRIAGYMVGPRNWGDPAARRYLERLIRAQ